MNSIETSGGEGEGPLGLTQMSNREAAISNPVLGSSTDPRNQPKSPPVESVSQLLREIYGGRFKRPYLKKSEISAMRRASVPDEREWHELIAMGLSDRTLENTKRLLLIGIRLSGTTISSSIWGFARDVLERHPMFQADSLGGALRNLPEAPTEARAVAALMTQELSAQAWPQEEKPLTKKQQEVCRVNAVHCLLLLFWATRGTRIEQIQRHLQSSLWSSASKPYRSPADKLYALITTKDAAAASIASEMLEKESKEMRLRADTAQRSQERAEIRARQLEEQLSTVGRQLLEAQAAVEESAVRIAVLTQEFSTARTHWQDDHSQLRGQMLRRLKEELALLDEGLQALRREPPKVHVMIDHAERAIDGLKREMDQMRGGD